MHARRGRVGAARDVTLAISAAFDRAELRKVRGRLAGARRLYERSLQLGPVHRPILPGLADLHLGFCDLLCEQNDMEAATHHMQQGADLGKHCRCARLLTGSARARARLRQIHGDLEGGARPA